MAGVLPASFLSRATAGFAASALPTYVSAMQPGWNLGNTLDAVPTETSWGNPPVTPEFIQQIAAQGFKSIRIPVTRMHHLGAAPDYRMDPAWMGRVQEIVDWSLDAGLYVMLNVPHDSWGWASAMPTQPDGVHARCTAIWTQLDTSGDNAGPGDWTSFKEFGTASAPAYARAAIAMTKKFFAETTAGQPIDFNFHFRSGRTVAYRFTGASGSVSDARPSSPPRDPAAEASASSSDRTSTRDS